MKVPRRRNGWVPAVSFAPRTALAAVVVQDVDRARIAGGADFATGDDAGAERLDGGDFLRRAFAQALRAGGLWTFAPLAIR